MSATWIRYFDEGYNACYLYNETTGESLWEDDCNTEGMYIIDGSQRELNVTDVSTRTPNMINRSIHSDDVTNEEEGFIRKKKAKRFRSKDYSREDQPLTDAQKTEFDLLCYTRFLFMNAVLLEAPISVIEGFVRLVFLGTACLTKIIFYGIFYRTKSDRIVPMLLLFLREILLTVAATLTLIIPGCILLVYRDFSYENDWQLRPLPTVLGGVDVRRFGTITYGGGALAINSGAHGYSSAASVNTDSTIVSTSAATADTTSSTTHKIGHGMDAWTGPVMWVPREIIGDVKQFMSGSDNNIDSLNIAL